MPQDSSSPSATAPAAVRDLPPSTKLVVKVLENDGELSQSQLAEETLLPKRTVRFALTKLVDEGVVSSRVSVMDARRRLYSLDASASNDGGELASS